MTTQHARALFKYIVQQSVQKKTSEEKVLDFALFMQWGNVER